MSLVNFTDLDFDQIRTSIIDYLRTNSDFTDYDYRGSNLSTIIDVLAYNTYITSYNANMLANECFIDSATLRENVVSLARNIGYVPRSRKSATTTISFTVDTTVLSGVRPRQLTLKKGIVTSTSRSFGNKSFSFCTTSDITVNVPADGIARFNDIPVYEGTLITDTFTYEIYDPNQRFILSAIGVDTSTLSVIVRTSQTSSVQRTYNQANSLFDVDSSSAVYWVQEIEDEQHELIFGDGVFGRKLEYPNFIEVSYVVGSASDANQISGMSFSGRIVYTSGTVSTPITTGLSVVTLSQPTYGGSDIENVDSIKKYSTRIYASQNRAVTAVDYQSLVPIIYPEAESVAVFGGEELSPPQYGKVFVSIKPYNGNFLSNLTKDNILREIRKYSVAGIVPEIIDLKYLYVETTSDVYYNSNISADLDTLKTNILTNIQAYSDSVELNKFGARFKYSQYLRIIDQTDESITSNITKIQIRRDLRPVLNAFTEYEICYGNRFHIKDRSGYNIRSSGFNVSGINGVVYLGDLPNTDLATGSLFLFSLKSSSQPIIVRNNVGEIDYLTGEIRIYPINIISTVVNSQVPIIEISAIPYSNDVIGLQDLYLQLDTKYSGVSMISDNISSGYSISGSNYNVSSSYSNGALVRGTPLVVSTATSEATNIVSQRLITSESGQTLYQQTTTSGSNGSVNLGY